MIPEPNIQTNTVPVPFDAGGDDNHRNDEWVVLAPLVDQVAGSQRAEAAADQRRQAELQSRLNSNLKKQARDSGEKQRHERQRENTVKFPKLDEWGERAIKLLVLILVVLFAASWFSAAVFLEINFTGSFLRGLLFTIVIPILPYIMKWFFLHFYERQRLAVEFVLVSLFFIGFFVFADRFGLQFAKQPGIELDVDNPLAPVSLRWYFYGTLMLESLGSFIFFDWLLGLIQPRLNPRWTEADLAVRTLDEQLDQLSREEDGLAGDLAQVESNLSLQRRREAALNRLLR